MSAFETDLDVSGLLEETQPAAQAGASPVSGLPPAIGRLIVALQPEPQFKVVTPVFVEVARILDYLRVIEGCLSRDKTLQRSWTIFRLIRERASALLNYISRNILEAEGTGGPLREVLDGTHFIISHELRRVFQEEIRGLGSPGSFQASRAQLACAHSLLQNCFRQSAVALAQHFDPALDSEALFCDYREKAERAFTLYRELTALITEVSRAEVAREVMPKLALINRLGRFRAETMHHLFYKDWEEFERFCDEVTRTCEELGELGPVLHRFGQYLRTLQNHVGMRSELKSIHAGTPPAQIDRRKSPGPSQR
ncbi:MAG TPA: hypothetical protein VN228_17110 [Pyrinomonadaceae bacterium]|nr:hypothetical protein [Pyrinomonadaceae bacterium]